jgi:hypothetical protein
MKIIEYNNFEFDFNTTFGKTNFKIRWQQNCPLAKSSDNRGYWVLFDCRGQIHKPIVSCTDPSHSLHQALRESGMVYDARKSSV